MKKSVIRLLMAVVLVFSAIALNPITASAKVNMPDKVRIGLYYEDTAQSRFNVSALKGLQFGGSVNGAFSVLFEDPSNNTYTVLKDSAASYHIMMYNSLQDYNTANIKAQAAKQAGIDAYPVFSDTWQVWTGNYTDAASANTAIASIQQKLGAGAYSVVNPTALRIAVQNSSGNTVFMFNSVNSVLQIYPRAENTPYVFSLNSSRYRGGLEVRRFTNSDMTIINVIPLEEYLYGVVPNEIQGSSNIEALKSQAVVARTYTVYNLNKHSAYKFDLCTTTYCQVYRGYGSEYSATNKAVDDSKGLIVTYNGKPAETLYCASSGGPTEDASNVWGSAVPYLVSVDNKYELTTSGHYYWQESFTPNQIKTIFLKYGYDLGDITGISVVERTTAGRVNKLLIQGTKDSKTLTKESTRDMLGLDSRMYDITSGSGATTTSLSVTNGSSLSNVSVSGRTAITANGLKQISSSSSLTILGANGTNRVGGSTGSSPATAKFVFSGKGWGHALGMSQEGARGMALAGFKFDQILTHYYPGTKVE